MFKSNKDVKVFSGVISTTSLAVFITARVASIFVSSTAMYIYDFHIFTVIMLLMVLRITLARARASFV